MKTFLLLLFSICIPFASFPQKINGILYEHPQNTLHPGIESMDYESFNAIRKTSISSSPLAQSIYFPDELNRKADSISKTLRNNRVQDSLRLDSIVSWLKTTYTSAVIETDTCLILTGFDKKIELCKRNGPDEKDWSSYEFRDYQRDYIVIGKYGYEIWEYIVFNPKTGNYRFLEHSPLFLDDSIVFCSDNYYGEGGFQIMQLTGKAYFGFESYGWELEECYRVNKMFYFSFRSNKDRSLKPRYLTINFDTYF